MPTLLIEHAGQNQGVVLDGRLLIGRVPPAGIVLPDPAVSRIHAWIDRVGDRYYVADADSRSGTVIDQFPIAGRHTLLDGDEIRIGSATLTYRNHDQLPDDIHQLVVSHTNGVAQPAAGGVLFACSCGAPLWAPLNWAGRAGKCQVCGQRTPVPALKAARPAAPPSPPTVSPATVSPPPPPKVTPSATTAVRQCSICQWAMETGESQTTCPSCGLTFHTECWEENKGCSAYGCASVEALADPEPEPEPEKVLAQIIDDEMPERFPIEFAMLGGSVICSLVGLLAFGLPSALLAIGTGGYWFTQRRRGESLRNGMVAAALAICVAGIFAGLWFSAFRWLHRPLAAPWQSVS